MIGLIRGQTATKIKFQCLSFALSEVEDCFNLTLQRNGDESHDCREGSVGLLQDAGEEIEAVRHGLANESLDLHARVVNFSAKARLSSTSGSAVPLMRHRSRIAFKSPSAGLAQGFRHCCDFS